MPKSYKNLAEVAQNHLVPSTKSEISILLRKQLSEQLLTRSDSVDSEATRLHLKDSPLKIGIVALHQINLYAGVYGGFTPTQLSAFLNSAVHDYIAKVKPHDGWPVHIVHPDGVPLNGPHTKYYPPIMSVLLLDDMDKMGIVVVFGKNFGDLDEIQSLVSDISWPEVSTEYVI